MSDTKENEISAASELMKHNNEQVYKVGFNDLFFGTIHFNGEMFVYCQMSEYTDLTSTQLSKIIDNLDELNRGEYESHQSKLS